jgi:hypothetical protein
MGLRAGGARDLASGMLPNVNMAVAGAFRIGRSALADMELERPTVGGRLSPLARTASPKERTAYGGVERTLSPRTRAWPAW